jgi:hypothetical protein
VRLESNGGGGRCHKLPTKQLSGIEAKIGALVKKAVS